MAERVDLYRHVPPSGENIPIFVEPFPVEDSVPKEDKIEWEVKWLQNHHSGGPSGMRDENLKGWLTEKRKEEAEAAKVALTKGEMTVLRGTGGGRRRREGRRRLRR